MAQLCRSETALDRRLFAFRPYPSPSGRHRASPERPLLFSANCSARRFARSCFNIPHSSVLKTAERDGLPWAARMPPKRTSAILGHDKRARGTAGAKERRPADQEVPHLPPAHRVSGNPGDRPGAGSRRLEAHRARGGALLACRVSGILLGSAHLFTPGPVAKAIGWPTSRFQWEVGLAGVGYGVAGVMAPAFDQGFWLATIIVFSIFMLGAAVGHVRSMIAEHNFAPGNAGYIFWYDILAPAFLVVMYVATR